MKKILAIDDKKANLTTIKAVIKSYIPDCKVLTAQSGKEGIEIAKNEQPDTILLDIIMPEIDGLEVCKRLKTDEATKNIPVIMISALRKDTESRIKSLSYGADIFISMPYDPVELCAIVNVMLRIKEAGDKLHAEKMNLEELIQKRVKELLAINKKLQLEITGRKFAEETIHHLNTVLRAIRSVNQLITQEINKDILLQKTCDILTETRGYYGAWIAIVNKNKKFKSFSESGIGKDFLQLMEALKGGEPVECVKRALNQSGVILIEDHNSVCKGCPLLGKVPHEKELTIQLAYNKKTFGVLSVSLPAELTTDKKEQSLFIELAGDISFALHNIEVDEQRKQAEEALRKSEQKLRNIFENSTNLFYSHTPEHILTYLSPQVENILGYTQEEALIKWTELMSDNPINEIGFNNTVKAIETGKSQPTYELELVKKKGEKIWVEVREAPVVKDGKTASIVGALTDITERKRADHIQKVLYNISNAVSATDNLEKLIGLIQKELGTIIDTTNFYIALYDSKTDSLSLPFFVDEKDKLTSFPAGKTLTYYVIKTQKSLLADKERMKKLEESGDVESFGADSEVWLGVPLRIEGEVTGVLAVQSYADKNTYNESDMEILEFISDQISISIDRKNAEEDLINALERATESDRLKSAFLNAMSHELRTPLNAVIGFSELIDKYTLIDDILDFCKTINNSGNHLLGIVEDIFDISMIESGELKIRKEKFEIAGFFKNIQTILIDEQKKENNQNIEILFKTCENYKDILVYSDHHKLKKILIHLLKNALKFTHEGYIEYGVSIVNINNESFLKFFVKDTGIGISKEKQKFIFNIFRQADDSDTRQYEGVGVGLSIAKRLTEFLGGKIWLESDEGKGSTFYFALPYTENVLKENVKKSAGTKKVNDFSDKTVLIVEDVESNYLYLEALLKALNLEILWAENGKEAMQFCYDNPDIDLVLMDIKMPVMDGYEASRKIREFNKDVVIMAQTAYALAGDRKKALEAGCNDYISKPIKKKILLEKIEKYLGK